MDAESDVPNTYAWACATSGRLTDAQKSRVRAAIRSGYGDIARGVLGWPFRRHRPSFGAPVAPDSRLAKVAEEAALEQGAALVGHGYRTWVIGAALASVDDTTVDAELLYVTSLLHDAGMVREVVGQDFTVRSGEILISVASRAGESEDRGRLAADAAVSHTTPGLTIDDNPIGFYVQAGAMADLAGLRMWDLPRGCLKAAYRDYPAHDIHRVIPALIKREARDVPDGRFAMLKRAGLDRMVIVSPTRLHAR